MMDLIGGIDVAYYTKNEKEYGVCVIDIFDFKTFDLVERQISISEIGYRYVPGELAKREIPIIMETYKKLINKADLYLLDGNGYLHQNHNGIATVFSDKTGERSIGVAKTFYNFSQVTYDLDSKKFSTAPIIINDEIYAYALRSKENSKPIFISQGMGISLNESLKIVKQCINDDSRIPIPTRIADIDTRRERKLILERSE